MGKGLTCLYTVRANSDYDQICNEPSTVELFLKTDTIAVTVPVCQKHLAIHNQIAAQRRNAQLPRITGG